jgi:recombinational DNA repair ATPase RecF
VPPSYAERVAANQQEFARLSEVYESLKRERGYLRKHDDEGIRAYNAEAAKYQADLAKARAEQTELIKLVAKK